jgi:hypothetical protein
LVYVFRRDPAGKWIDTQYLKAPNPDEWDNFGYGVAITPDSIAVGAQRECGAGNGPMPDFANGAFEAGAVYVFREVATP